METLRDYVNWGITHSDKTGSAEGVPLVMEKCKLNKRMKQLEVYGNSIQNGTPTPENPIEVESVGEKCTKNLFDKDNIVYHGGFNSVPSSLKSTTTGISYNVTSPGSSSSIIINFGKASDYAGKWLTFTSTDYYSKNTAITIRNVAVGSSAISSGSEVTSDGNGLYSSTIYVEEGIYTDEVLCLRLYGNASSDVVEYSNIMVSVGEVPEKYEPYGKYKIPVTVRGKNLFKPTVVSTNTIRIDRNPSLNGPYGTVIDSTDFADNKVIVTQTPNSDYDTGSYWNGYMYFEIPELVIGKKYRLSFDLNVTDNPLNATSLVMYALNNSIGVVSITPNRCKITFTYKTPVTGRKPDIELRCGGASFELSNVMITEEGQDETFEPYIEPQTTNVYLNEPLRKIGDYADYIDFKARKVVRNTYKRVYDGVNDNNNPFNIADNEYSWDVADSGSFWQCTLNDLLPVIPKNGYADFTQIPKCLQLPVKTGVFSTSSSPATVDKDLIWYSNTARNVRLFLAKERFDGTVTGLRSAYLKANPITVYCAIYEPYEEPITCELPILPAKTSIVEINTSILPSNIKGKYIKR